MVLEPDYSRLFKPQSSFVNRINRLYNIYSSVKDVPDAVDTLLGDIELLVNGWGEIVLGEKRSGGRGMMGKILDSGMRKGAMSALISGQDVIDIASVQVKTSNDYHILSCALLC